MSVKKSQKTMEAPESGFCVERKGLDKATLDSALDRLTMDGVNRELDGLLVKAKE